MDKKVWPGDKDIESLLASAFEGGSNYWYKIVDYKRPKQLKPSFPSMAAGVVFKHIDYPMSEGGAVIVRVKEEGEKTYSLDKESIKQGLKIMSQKYPKHFEDALSDYNADAETGDVFLQCCLFGEVVYG